MPKQRKALNMVVSKKTEEQNLDHLQKDPENFLEDDNIHDLNEDLDAWKRQERLNHRTTIYLR